MSDGKDDDISSVCSTFSMVSINGEECSADVAVDDTMKRLQTSVNNIHCGLREMLQLDERGEDYSIMKEKHDAIDALCREGRELWKDAVALSKQLVPPRPRAKTTKKAEQPLSVLEACSGGGH